MSRRSFSIVATFSMVAAMLAAFVVAPPNADATSYRYWVYWVGGTGDWAFSHQGASHQPADGTVEGWRFAISKEAASSATPRVSSSFDDICGKTDAVAGKKRVGLVLDFGVSSDAPPGQTPPKGPVARCFVLPTNATGYDVLAAATSLRVEQGMICGIAGYPKAGCGEAVANPKPTPTSSGGGPGNNQGNSGGSSNQHATGAPSEQPSGNHASASPSPSASGGGRGDRHQGQPKPDGKGPSAGAQPPANGDSETPVKASVALNAGLPETNTDPQSPIGLLIGLTVVLGLLGLALFVARRR